MNIKLKFLGVGYCNVCQAQITIRDVNGNKILKSTTYNGELNISLKPNNTYIIEGVNCYSKLYKCFYVSKNICKYQFVFDNAYMYYPNDNINIRSFILTDYYYNNLPIEKGEINFG